MLAASFERLDQYIRNSETASDLAIDVYPMELSVLIEHLFKNGGVEGRERLQFMLQTWHQKLTETVALLDRKSIDTMSAEQKRTLGRALFFLGMFEKEGFGRAAAPERAVAYFERAGQVLGFTPALVQLALIKFYIHKDIEAGIALLESAIAQGNARAMFRRGQIYLHGYFRLPSDRAQGMRLLEQAAELNQYEAMVELAEALKDERSEENKARIKALFMASAELGNTDATLFMGALILHSLNEGAPLNEINEQIDIARVQAFYQEAAIRGVPDALGGLAYLSALFHVGPSRDESIQMSEYAITLDSSYGMLARAIQLLEGEDVPVDYARAFWLLNRAIMQDEANQQQSSIFFGWFHRYYHTSGRMGDHDRAHLLDLMWQDFLANKAPYKYIIYLLSYPATQELIANRLISEVDHLPALHKILTSEDHVLNILLRPARRQREGGDAVAVNQFARVQAAYAAREAQTVQSLFLVDGTKFQPDAAISRSLQMQSHYDRRIWGAVGAYLFSPPTAEALAEKLRDGRRSTLEQKGEGEPLRANEQQKP